MSGKRAARRTGVLDVVIALVAGLNALAALAGALGLASGVLGLDAVSTSRLPWGSTVVGGVALGLLVAVPNAVLAVLAARHDRRTGPAAVLVGALLVLWILVELACLRELSPFHPVYVAVGLWLVWLGLRRIRAANGIPAAVVLGQVRTVAEDLPLMLTSPLYRHWHLRWGATDAEVHASMAGDDLLPGASYRTTRAITIDAPVDQVWPWLVQVGCGRAGFYADDLLDNLGRPSATSIQPELQHLVPGQRVPMSPSATSETAFLVDSYDAPSWLLWRKPDSTWSWLLTPTTSGGTRVVTRLRAVHDWHRPAEGALSWLLLELGDFAMMRRMLRGLKRRAEAPGDARPGGTGARVEGA